MWCCLSVLQTNKQTSQGRGCCCALILNVIKVAGLIVGAVARGIVVVLMLINGRYVETVASDRRFDTRDNTPYLQHSTPLPCKQGRRISRHDRDRKDLSDRVDQYPRTRSRHRNHLMSAGGGKAKNSEHQTEVMVSGESRTAKDLTLLYRSVPSGGNQRVATQKTNARARLSAFALPAEATPIRHSKHTTRGTNRSFREKHFFFIIISISCRSRLGS